MIFKKVKIIETGGTIACNAFSSVSAFYASPTETIATLLEDLFFEGEVILECFSKKISQEFSMDDILKLAKNIQDTVDMDEYTGVVVSIGTNALEDIAYVIGILIDTKKPIVFTGANFPRDSLSFDGKKNIYNAVQIVFSQQAYGLGSLVTFNDRIICARTAAKITPGLHSTFSLENIGLLGYVIAGKVQFHAFPKYRHTYNSELHLQHIIFKVPKVAIIYAHIEMEDYFIKAALEEGVCGIISAGFGVGYQSKKITEALYKAVQKGVYVVRCSRSGIFYSNYDENYDQKYGFIFSQGLSAHKSNLLLSIALSCGFQDRENLERIFMEY